MDAQDALTQTFYSLALDTPWTGLRQKALEAFAAALDFGAVAWQTDGFEGRVHAGQPFEGGVVWLTLTDASGRRDIFLRPSGTADSEPPRALGHLPAAHRHAMRLYVMRDEWLDTMGRPSRGSAALIDDEGRIHAASPRFTELTVRGLADVETIPSEGLALLPGRLPFLVPAYLLTSGQGRFQVGRLQLRLDRDGPLWRLHARLPLPLDQLSPREQDIARALGQGKTFKSVARQYGIAVSTVANHASRIYRKLSIYRREELVELLRTPNQTITQGKALAIQTATPAVARETLT